MPSKLINLLSTGTITLVLNGSVDYDLKNKIYSFNGVARFDQSIDS